MDTAAEKTKVYGSFLRDHIVKVKPIEAGARWANLLSKGQDLKKEAFLLGKVKRSFQVPLRSERSGGGVKMILDDIERKLIKKYESEFPSGMTQKEFFEKELGVDLNHTNAEATNFWRTNRMGRVTLTKEGMSLNLNVTVDMLKYLILMANESFVCPNYDDRERKATYQFMIVDENQVTQKNAILGDLKADAYIAYAELKRNKESLIGFLRAQGKTVTKAATEDWLREQIQTQIESDPQRFLSVVNSPDYEERIFIQKAIDANAILKKGEKRYTLDNGVELGDIKDVITYFQADENKEVKLRVKAQIELFNRK